ncbi:MAG: ABC transporter permease [Acidobacteria bacterium]|nr:MAG: ABC transporter permease [Acidobacteriota bacterium]
MSLLNTLRFAFRQLRKSPGFTAVAVLSLGLGIGAGTAVFSLVNAILLSSLPVPNPQELRVLKWNGSDVRMTSFNGGAGIDGNRWTGADSVSPPTFARLREQVAGQAELFGFAPVDDVITRGPAESFTARGTMVSDNFFSGVGVRPLIGRILAPGEDYAGAMSIVISYGLWERQYDLDPGVLGRTLSLNRTGFTIIGVLPKGFTGVQPGRTNDFYVPLEAQSPFLYRPINDTFHWCIRLMARLTPGGSDTQFAAKLDAAFGREVAAVMKDPRIVVEPGHGGLTNDRYLYQRPLLLMLGVVGLVLLVACANLAGLSLARGAARQHELAVRAALGAGRWRLIRQSLTESLVLGLLGGGLGVLLAVWLRSTIASLLTGSAGALSYDVSLDGTVLAFTLTIALITALVSGLLPALRAGRVDALTGLKSRGALGRPRLRAGRVLIAAQVCLSLLLVTGAALYLRTLVNVTRIDPGFKTERLLLFQLNLRGSSNAEEQPAQFCARVQEALSAMPGVQAASFIEFPLLEDGGSTGSFDAFSGRARAGGATMSTNRLRVGETFFTTMGIPLLQGRAFTAADNEAAPKVIVVNEAFVREFLPGDNPLGLTMKMWEADWQIIGVCRNAKYSALRQPAPPTTYFPFRQMFYSRFRRTHLRNPYFAVRTALPPTAIAAGVRKTVAEIDSDVPITNLTTQEDVRDRRISRERLFASLCGALASLAVLLACVGLYGLLAYNVARSVGDIGIRMALGATRPDIVWRVLREAAVLSLAGTAVGVPVALALTSLVEAQLYEVKPNDPATLVGTSALLIAVALLAAWIPARRAAKVDPIVTLRCE